MEKKQLQKVAKELNEVLELEEEDQIDPTQKPKELEKELKQAVAGSSDSGPELDIYDEDEFSEEVWKLLAELGNSTAIEKMENEKGSSKEDEAEEEEEEQEEEEEEEEEVDYDALTEEIEGAKKIADLKKIAKENEDTFSDLDYKKFKKAADLRQAMLDEIEKIAPKSEDEESDEEEEDFVLPISKEELMGMKKSPLLKFIKEHELDVETDQAVKKIKEEIVENYEFQEAEEKEKEEEKPAPKPAKKKEEKKSESKPAEKKEEKKTSIDHSKSNKAIVYQRWQKGEENVDKLIKNVSVKETTIKNWINQWKKGKNLPAIAKK